MDISEERIKVAESWLKGIEFKKWVPSNSLSKEQALVIKHVLENSSRYIIEFNNDFTKIRKHGK